MIAISIIMPASSEVAINNVIDNEDFGCVFHKYVYNQLEDISQIYEECKNISDVLFFSGELGYHYALTNIYGLNLPCSFIFYETKHVLSILLDFTLKHPEIPLSRVFIDFLSPVNNHMNISHYIAPENMPMCFEHTNYTYEEIGKRIDQLYAEDKVDFILMRSIKNLPKIKALGIQYQHILPNEEIISESIFNAINSVRLLIKDTDKTLVIIKPQYLENYDTYEREYYKITLYKLLVDFRKESEIQFLIDANTDYFELQLERTSVDISPTIKELISYLNEFCPIDFHAGASCGESWNKSRYLAEIALQESIKYGVNDGFLMYGNEEILTGPLSISKKLSYSYSNHKAVSYAHDKGIGEHNLLKIIGIYEMDKQIILTSTLLSHWLNITTRSCNRILLQLLESQLIVEIPPIRMMEKGRPSKQYKFLAKNMDGFFS